MAYCLPPPLALYSPLSFSTSSGLEAMLDMTAGNLVQADGMPLTKKWSEAILLIQPDLAKQVLNPAKPFILVHCDSSSTLLAAEDHEQQPALVSMTQQLCSADPERHDDNCTVPRLTHAIFISAQHQGSGHWASSAAAAGRTSCIGSKHCELL